MLLFFSTVPSSVDVINCCWCDRIIKQWRRIECWSWLHRSLFLVFFSLIFPFSSPPHPPILFLCDAIFPETLFSYNNNRDKSCEIRREEKSSLRTQTQTTHSRTNTFLTLQWFCDRRWDQRMKFNRNWKKKYWNRLGSLHFMMFIWDAGPTNFVAEEIEWIYGVGYIFLERVGHFDCSGASKKLIWDEWIQRRYSPRIVMLI